MFRNKQNKNIYSEKDISEIYELYVTKIYKFFYAKTLSKQIAEDLTSETFIVFIKIIKKDSVNTPQALLYGIAKKIFVRYLRDKYKRNELSFGDFERLSYENFEAGVEETAKSKTPEERIIPYLKLLPDRQRAVLRLRLIEKLSLKEIAQKLGKNMNYVKTTQKRGLKSLKELIECTPPGTNSMKGGNNV